MLPLAKVQEVERLLAERAASQRKIAKIVGVSRGTVSSIANGHYTRRRRPEPSPEDDFFAASGPLARCGKCGGKVFMPCRLCYVRAWKANERQHADRRSHRASRPSQVGSPRTGRLIRSGSELKKRTYRR